MNKNEILVESWVVGLFVAFNRYKVLSYVYLGSVLHKHTMECIVRTFNLQKCSLWSFPWHQILPILFLMIFFLKARPGFSFLLIFSFQHCVVVRSQSDGCFPSEEKILQEACIKVNR